MKNVKEIALEICLNDKLSAEEQHDLMLDLGLDLEDMVEIAFIAGDMK